MGPDLVLFSSLSSLCVLCVLCVSVVTPRLDTGLAAIDTRPLAETWPSG